MLPMALSTPSADAELIPLARNGQAEACTELVTRHRQAAFLFALQLLGNRDDALDVTQDALLRFVTTLGRFDAGRPIRPWLFRIVRNCARDLMRRHRVRQTESLDDHDEDSTPRVVVDPAPDPEAVATRRQLQARVWHALAALSEPHREILVLRDYQDLAYAEIAQALDIPIGTVMSRLHAARRALRQLLAPHLSAEDFRS